MCLRQEETAWTSHVLVTISERSAHIERITGKYADICLIPETVFCFDDMGKAAYDTTGSPWTQVNIRNMKPAGYRNPHIQDMGIREAQQYGQSKVRCSGQEMGIQRTESVVTVIFLRNWFRYHIMKHRDRERTGEYTFRKIHSRCTAGASWTSWPQS